MNSKMFSVSGRDFVRGLITAILVAVFSYLAPIVGLDGIDGIAISGFAAYIVNIFFSDEQGKVLGAI